MRKRREGRGRATGRLHEPGHARHDLWAAHYDVEGLAFCFAVDAREVSFTVPSFGPRRFRSSRAITAICALVSRFLGHLISITSYGC